MRSGNSRHLRSAEASLGSAGIGTEPLRVLTICSGNICRSPMAAVMLRSRLEDRGIPVEVASAGFLTHDRPAPPQVLDVLRTRGLDASDHRSRRLVAADLDEPDLVLCMERQHVREVTVLAPHAFERTFTVPELARRARLHGPRRPDESVRDWLGRVGTGRRPSDLLGNGGDDEVPDPYGRAKSAYRRTAEMLDELLDVVVSHLYP